MTYCEKNDWYFLVLVGMRGNLVLYPYFMCLFLCAAFWCNKKLFLIIRVWSLTNQVSFSRSPHLPIPVQSFQVEKASQLIMCPTKVYNIILSRYISVRPRAAGKAAF